jgi:hypothetical protein
MRVLRTRERRKIRRKKETEEIPTKAKGHSFQPVVEMEIKNGRKEIERNEGI